MKRTRTPFAPISILFVLSAACLWLGGTTGCQSAPPTKVEHFLFDVTTNRTEVVEPQTVQEPEVTRTNVVTMDQATGATVTNSVTRTNWVSREILVTNVVEEYALSPNATAKAAQESGAAIANLLAPGSGSLVGLILGAIPAIWATLRSRKKGAVAASTMQGLQVFRAFIQQTEGGQAVDRELTRWLQKHQVETGVANEVLKLLGSVVDDRDAKRVASEIQDILAKG